MPVPVPPAAAPGWRADRRVVGYNLQILEHAPTIDVTGPIQAAGTPHPDWSRPLEVHDRRLPDRDLERN
jgi:hypothetical protein